MTESTEPAGQPTNAMIMSLLAGLTETISIESAAIRAEIAEHRAETAAGFRAVRADVGQLRADVAHLKVEVLLAAAFEQDTAQALRLHIDDPDAHRRAA